VPVPVLVPGLMDVVSLLLAAVDFLLSFFRALLLFIQPYKSYSKVSQQKNHLKSIQIQHHSPFLLLDFISLFLGILKTRSQF
jgi:hypothetical protein